MPEDLSERLRKIKMSTIVGHEGKEGVYTYSTDPSTNGKLIVVDGKPYVSSETGENVEITRGDKIGIPYEVRGIQHHRYFIVN
tara:strand:- start:2028 stop:2276 length:249 start_codon:yes stop_codon:yes gene_type:complete